jgi:tRNA A37 threonylcarbamoyltransferase TsaD
MAEKYHWTIYIPKFSYTTDNAAMIGIVGYYKYMGPQFCWHRRARVLESHIQVTQN